MYLLTNPKFACSLFLSSLILVTVPSWADDPNAAAKEKELLSVLRSDSPAAEKAIACKNLAIYGSDECVSDLALLLPDPQLSSWARIALEAIPGDAASGALRSAVESLDGRLLIGMINSVGVRRDSKAVEILVGRLQDADIDVASAAAVALGHIGSTDAVASLRQSLNSAETSVRSAVAEGCVLCAEQLLANGKLSEAVEIYDQVRNADVPQQRIIEATRGAILAKGSDGIPLLLKQFRSPNKRLFQLALGTLREFPGDAVDKALAADLANMAPERAALTIHAMADRPQTVVLPAILSATQKGPDEVRLAAIDALGRVGDANCLSPLLEIALEPNKKLAKMAMTALTTLPGVDAQVVTLLSNSNAKTYPALIELVGQRRIGAVPELLKAVDHSDARVRSAALTALGETIGLDQLSVLLAQVVAPKHAEDAEVAQQALKAASIRMPDREACATEIAAAISQASSAATKKSLLEILGTVGGTKALATLGTAAKGSDIELQDTSTRLLGEWMTEDAAPVLLDLAKTAPGEKYQIRSLRGYIRIARQFVLPDSQRAEMCQHALTVARQPSEQKMVLDVLQRYPSQATLKLAMEASQTPGLKDDATRTALAIAQEIGGNADVVKDLK